jgi:hypothetical protein
MVTIRLDVLVGLVLGVASGIGLMQMIDFTAGQQVARRATSVAPPPARTQPAVARRVLSATPIGISTMRI